MTNWKTLRGRDCGLMKLVSWHLPEGPEETTNNICSVADHSGCDVYGFELV
jgi:hypothetical protein